MPYKDKKKQVKCAKRWRSRNKQPIAEYQRKRYQENRDILRDLKINGCAICGYNKCMRALQFHHVNPKDKKFMISSQAMENKNLVNELNKCILLCANCHLEIHSKEK